MEKRAFTYEEICKEFSKISNRLIMESIEKGAINTAANMSLISALFLFEIKNTFREQEEE